MASPLRNQDTLPTWNYWKSMNPIRRVEKPQKSANAFRTRQIDIEGISALDAPNPGFEVKFYLGDPENPRNWSPLLRTLVVGSLAYTAWAALLFSTCYGSGIPGMMEDFGIHNETVLQLGLSLYLVGMGIGSLILAPLSETFGRRPVYIVSLIAFLVLVPLCATAKTFTQVLICRFLASLVGVVVLAVAPGSIVDVVEPRQLQLAVSVYSIGPMNGPVTGPIIVGLGGFTFQRWGWRSLNWLVLILVGVGALCIFLIPETYEPVILRKRAALRRKETGNSAWWSQYDNKIAFPQVIKVAIGRPFKLAFTEPVLWFWNMYISIIYAILYLSFVAYPIVYSENRHWSAGLSGLSFLGVFIGTSLATACVSLFRKIIAAQPKDPRTGKPTPEASLSVVCIAAILAPVGQLIFALTSLPTTIHWAGGLIAGIPFGLGNTVIFIYGTHYISMAYGRYASSALAGNAVCRFVLGAILVLVGSDMYSSLTPRIAGLVLAGMEFAIIPIPFVFYYWGAKIRMRSQVVQEMMAKIEGDSRDVMDSRYGPDPGHNTDIEPNLGAGGVGDSGYNTNSESIEMKQIVGAGNHEDK